MEKTRFYAFCTDALQDPGLYGAALDAVTAQRREKTERYRFEKDRRLSLGAGLLFSYAMRTAGLDPAALTVTEGPHGKPQLKEADVHFNLSHSGNFSVCAVSDRRVGCDIEELAPYRIGVAHRFFTAEETRMIEEASSEEERRRRFCRIWTLKESYVKLTGAGLSCAPDSFSVRLTPGGMPDLQSVGGSDVFFTEYHDLPGVCAALCSEDGACVPLTVLTAEKLIEAV